MEYKLIDLLTSCGAIKFGEFVLSSGKRSNYYVDIKQASTNPDILKIIAREMKRYTDRYEIVAGMELGAVPIAVALSLESGKPFVIVRKNEKKHGTKRLLEGPDVRDRRVLIVEDVTTTGRSVIKAADILREEGAIIDRVVTVVDREEGAKENLMKSGLDLISLVSKSEILKKD